MSWSDISEAIKEYAPLAASALTSPVGMVLGVGTVISKIFGVDADPKSVSDYINNNPEKAKEQLKNEMANNIEFQNLVLASVSEKNRHDESMESISLQNVESARNNSKNVNDSPVDNKIKMISLNFNMFMLFLSVSVFIFTIYWDLKYGKTIDAGLSAMLGMMIGQFSAPLKDVINYFFGTSLSSKRKDDTISYSIGNK